MQGIINQERIRKMDIKALDMLGMVILGVKTNGKRFASRLVSIEKEYYISVSSDGKVFRNWKGSMVDLTTFEEEFNRVVE